MELLLDAIIFQKFCKRIAIRFYDSHRRVSELNYGQLWHEMERVARVLKEQDIEGGQLVGVQLYHCPALIAVIGGIIISGNSFHCMDCKSGKPQPGNDLCAAYFLGDVDPLRQCDSPQILLGIRICTVPLVFVSGTSRVASYPELAFCVRTSGSTGQPKTVLVPKSCIMPNVLVLSEQFAVDEHDVIYVCSPPTFDPFVVDILIGLRAGACLLLVDNATRLSAPRLLDVLFPGVTMMQITPSMFSRWSEGDMKDTIFGAQSTLRVLALGGEKFPILHRPPECRTTVYNIYGITEVSCWSMIQKVSNEKCIEVPLGQPLDGSLVLQIRNVDDEQEMAENTSTGSTIGHLYIGSSTRKCLILGDTNEAPTTQPVFRSTGDLVERTPDGHYFFRGRCNRTIKRFGCRVSLSEVEAVVQCHPAVQQCASCVIREQDRFVVFVKSDTHRELSFEQMLWKEMRTKLRPEQLPDELHRIEQLPLSLHGKICTEGLTKLYDELKSKLYSDCTGPVEYLEAELNAMGIVEHVGSRHREDGCYKKIKSDASFIDRGGTSIAALRLHAAMEEKCGVRLPDLLTMLIDTSVPLGRVFSYVAANATIKYRSARNDSPQQLVSSDRFVIDCHYNLKKCIDSQPTIAYCNAIGCILSVGSHSGMLLTINIDTNGVLSRLFLPDRVECAVSFFNSRVLSSELHPTLYGVVGCYDGFLYCFNPLDGSIAWKYDAGGMIKCAALVVPNETNVIVVGSYSPIHNLHCIVRAESDTVVRWKVKIGTKPILAQTVALGGDVGAGHICVATLDGTIASVSVADGHLAWTRTTSPHVPIFSSPIFLPEHNRIVCCGVDGTLGIWNARDGTALSTHQLPGNVFSSFETVKQSPDCLHLIVGCYDRNVHCIEYRPANDDSLVPVWQVEVQSQIYATPRLIGSRQLIVCTTSGWLNLVNLDGARDGTKPGRIVATMQMNGELFATPVAHENVLPCSSSVYMHSNAAFRMSNPSSTVCLNGPISTSRISSFFTFVSEYSCGSSSGSRSRTRLGLL
uniref:Carrier domain-containing protein n=1 Tax=Anopheles dirus TaxID=7168 RepID=A0A182NP41_9DIPT